MTAWLWTVAGLWLLFSASRVYDVLGVPDVDAVAALATGPPRRPRVSVVMAARNEGARIESSVRRLLCQQEIEVEVVVVDDRSTDDTCEILERLSTEHERLQVIRVEDLPEGWLGKPYALHLGSQAVRGDWLLFTDADAWMAPDLLQRAVGAAEAEKADHLSLLPGESDVTLSGKAALLAFSMGLIFFAARTNRDRRWAAVGIGAFNLVRAAAYRSVGGHEPLRFEVIDDLGLGVILRRGGYRSRCYGARPGLEVHWAPTARDIVRALEKNYFALFGYSYLLAGASVIGMAAVHLSALLGPFSGRPAGIAAGLALATVIVPTGMLSRRAGWGRLPAFLSPLVGLIIPIALLNSMWTTLRHGGIRWRGTFYSLDALRRSRGGLSPGR